MKVLMLNGSPKPNGNTFDALTAVGEQLLKEGIEYEIFNIGEQPIRDCIGCKRCTDKGCVFADDRVNEFIEKAKTADGIVFGTPVYYAHPSGRILSFLDRAFYSGKNNFIFKPAASVAVGRRAGTTASVDVLNKYFSISQMPIAGSTYWNVIHGATLGDTKFDGEGVQTMQNLAKNLAWLIKCIDCGKHNGINLPDSENSIRTNFVR